MYVCVCVCVCFFFQDYLQAPLQPLMDNLESQTYEAFEKDPVKYSQYEKAIVRALEKAPKQDEIVVMVSGSVGFSGAARNSSSRR